MDIIFSIRMKYSDISKAGVSSENYILDSKMCFICC